MNRIKIVDGIYLYKQAFMLDSVMKILYEQLNIEKNLETSYSNTKIGKAHQQWHGIIPFRHPEVSEPYPITPFTSGLSVIQDSLQSITTQDINNCLVNWYRDGDDYSKFHNDLEGNCTGDVLSVSFGATRTFSLAKGIYTKGTLKNSASYELHGGEIHIPLEHGDLITMNIASQEEYLHSVLKEACDMPRLNITFRTMLASET